MMNAAHLHLLVNHLPVVIPLVAFPILVAGLISKSTAVQKVGLCLLIVSASVAVPAYLSGEPAESFLKNYPGVSRLVMNHHEEAARFSLIGIECLGAMALFLLLTLLRKKNIRRVLWAVFLMGTLIELGLLMRTSHLGGQIRHEEIQSDDLV